MTTISLCFEADLNWIPRHARDDLLTDLFSTLRAYLLKYKLQKILLKIPILRRARLTFNKLSPYLSFHLKKKFYTALQFPVSSTAG